MKIKMKNNYNENKLILIYNKYYSIMFIFF